MSDRFVSILLFGAPGAGKGTQGKILASVPGMFHHSSGEVFRNLNPKTAPGKTFMEYSSRGELVPDDLTISVWRENLDQQIRDGKFHPNADLLVLDGIPRNSNQAILMDAHIDVHKIIHLGCGDHEALIARLRKRALEENRFDDAKEDVIRRRFEVYTAETRPVLDHYADALIAEIDAMGTPMRVLRDILNILIPVQQEVFGAA